MLLGYYPVLGVGYSVLNALRPVMVERNILFVVDKFQFSLWQIWTGWVIISLVLMTSWLNHFAGQTDTLLSDEGIKQAQLAGNKLNDEVFSHIYSSDLKRARKVCQTIFSLLWKWSCSSREWMKSLWKLPLFQWKFFLVESWRRIYLVPQKYLIFLVVIFN